MYWTSPKKFISSLKKFIDSDLKEIVIFEKKDHINSFIYNIEYIFNIRKKKKFYINYFLIKMVIKIFILIRIRKGLIDKFLTFTTNTNID